MTLRKPDPRLALSDGLAILVLLSVPVALGADTIDPANDGSQYAWAANLGWINAEPGGDGGSGAGIHADLVEGWLWSATSGWISLSCTNTASCSEVDYRVTHDGAGNLAGYAWSPNVGWISFSCVNTSSCGAVDYGVVADPGSGALSGHAWAANVGWISFSCSNQGSCGSVDYGVATQVPFFDALIFTDDFESGGTGSWSGGSP